MTSMDEWERWTADFHAETPGEAPVELHLLSQHTERQGVRLRWALALEVLGAVVVLAFWTAVLLRGANPALVVMAGLSFAFLFAWLSYLFYVQRGAWNAVGQHLLAHVELSLRRSVAALRWYRFARAITALFALGVAAWAPMMLHAHRAMYAAEPWRAVLGFGGAFAILAACMRYYERELKRARREAEAWKRTLEELQAPEG